MISRLKIPLIFLTIILFSGCAGEEMEQEQVLTEFQTETIEYFGEVALGVEFGDFSEVTRKWKFPMKIFTGGKISEANMVELEIVRDELNELVTDGFEIQFVQDSTECNFYIHFGSREVHNSNFPEISFLAAGEPALSYVYFNQRAELIGGHMFVDVTRTSPLEQKHLIREELTQAIGLARHSDRQEISIFNPHKNTLTSFATIDAELVRLLYHPNMVVGLTYPGCKAILQNVYSDENSD